MRKSIVTGILTGMLWVFSPGAAQPDMNTTNHFFAYIGTYTGPESKGIYVSRFDAASGRMEPATVAAETPNPTFLVIHPNGKWLYAVSEIGNFEGKRAGAVAAFSIDRATGKLTLLNRMSSGGAGPCHVSLDATGRYVLAANYGGGSVSVLPVGEDGALKPASAFSQHQGSSVNRRRQEGPHAHQIQVDPSNRFALVCDLGLDQVMVYRFDAAKGTLELESSLNAKLPPGAGPRHLAIHPDRRSAYVINELDSTIAAFTFSLPSGGFTRGEIVSTLPKDFSGNNSTAEIEVHPLGRFVYGSNRGHNSIVAFAIESATGKLRLIGHTPTQGKAPRHFAIDPSGQWLLAENQDSGNIAVFRIDRATGQLSAAPGGIQAPAPVCLQFLAAPKP